MLYLDSLQCIEAVFVLTSYNLQEIFLLKIIMLIIDLGVQEIIYNYYYNYL